MQKQTLSTNKIILFVVFICAAIMASLFVFHMRQKTMAVALAPDQGIIFPVARDIKPFELRAENNQKFTQDNFRGHWTLIIFGFTHCAEICPTTLAMLNRIYPQLHMAYPNLQVVMVSLDPNRDTPEQVATYTRSFHPDFIGVTGPIQDLHKIQSQFGIYSARVGDGMSDHYQIQHTSSILLINPQGKWAALYPYGMKPDVFIHAVKISIPS